MTNKLYQPRSPSALCNGRSGSVQLKVGLIISRYVQYLCYSERHGNENSTVIYNNNFEQINNAHLNPINMNASTGDVMPHFDSMTRNH